MDNIGVYKVSRPSAMSELIGIILLIVIQFFSIFRFNSSTETVFFSYFRYAWVIFCLIIVIVLLYRMLTIRRKIEIQIHPDAIVLEDQKIKATMIKDIYVRGYFKPVIGIKLVDSTFVPYRLCFSFLDLEYKGMKELSAWAERNQIKLSNKRFMRWL